MFSCTFLFVFFLVLLVTISVLWRLYFKRMHLVTVLFGFLFVFPGFVSVFYCFFFVRNYCVFFVNIFVVFPPECVLFFPGFFYCEGGILSEYI